MKGNTAFVGEFSLDPVWVEALPDSCVTRTALPLSPFSMTLGGVLSRDEVTGLRRQVESQEWIPVGLNGMKGDYTPGDPIGSWRASCFEPVFADRMMARMKTRLPDVWSFRETDTECGVVNKWRLVGMNPLFRFIKYEQGGALVPHYDWAFQAPGDKKKTLVTVVLYLTDTRKSGRTRFIKDPKAGIPVAQRDLSDWTRSPAADEVVYAHGASVGDALLFEHSILHDSEDYSGGEPKIIARTDLVFEPEM